MEILGEIRRKFMHFRWRPIRVFCLHHVSDVYEPSYMWECDWTETERFKGWVTLMQQNGYHFISLSEAQRHLGNDCVRCRKYAVITADDGFRTLLNILPWLEEQHIPITLFVNPKYMLEDTIGPNVLEKLSLTQSKPNSCDIYLKREDIEVLLQSPLVTLAHHGYEHLDSIKLSTDALAENVERSIEALNTLSFKFLPFYAYPHGHALKEYDRIVCDHGLIPVYVSGNKNYNDDTRIDRELISNERIEKGLV